MISFLTWIFFFHYSSVPAGTVRINDYYVDKTEIQNIHWLEYMYHMERELPLGSLHKLLPDTANTWFSDPANRNKPIVLITHAQALDYCAWRSGMVTKKLGKKVTYRLPTAAEWKAIAEEILKEDQRQADKELTEMRRLVEKDPKLYLLAEQKDPKNRVCNFFDNVSEMTSEKGLAMGANNSALSDLHSNLTKTISYTSSDRYVGFRCVAEIE